MSPDRHCIFVRLCGKMIKCSNTFTKKGKKNSNRNQNSVYKMILTFDMSAISKRKELFFCRAAKDEHQKGFSEQKCRKDGVLQQMHLDRFF